MGDNSVEVEDKVSNDKVFDELSSKTSNELFPPDPSLELAETQYQCKYFWKTLNKYWATLYQEILQGKTEEVHKFLHSHLHDKLKDFIELTYTLNEVNLQAFPKSKGHVEIYISPKFHEPNIKLMQMLYDYYEPISKQLTVVKYKPYHIQNPIITDISYEGRALTEETSKLPEEFQKIITTPFTAKYDDFGVQVDFGIKDGNRVMNIVVMVKKELADVILIKNNVKFENGTNRDVWFSNFHGIVEKFLISTLGEYNMLHHVGYIEIMHEDDIDKNMPADAFKELEDLRKHLRLLLKTYNYNECSYCMKMQLQTKLFKCAKCQDKLYCSRLCQSLAWPQHKRLCVKYEEDVIDITRN